MKTKDELKDHAIQYLAAYQSDMEQLQSDREKWIKYYYQDDSVYDNPESRSRVVASDVHDTIESLLPQLMDIFWGGADVIQCSPQGAEDEQAAKAMEMLINHQMQRDIDGYKVIHDWIKDSLLQKVSFVKWGWEETEEINDREFEDLTELELRALMEREDITVENVVHKSKQAAVIDETGMTVTPEVMEFDVYAKERKEISRPWVEFCPADEIVFDVRAKNVKDMSFIAHKKRVHKTYLTKYGVNIKDVGSVGDDWRNDSLVWEKFKDLGGTVFWQDPSNDDMVFIYECFLCDYKKNGTKLHKKVTIFGNQVLEIEDNVYKRPPFCALSPILMPGRLVGRGEAELSTDFQDINTALTRSILDNCYYDILGVRVVNPFRIDPNTLLEGNRPGGVVLTKDDIDPSRAIHELRPNQLPPHIFQMLQYQETRKETKTGINKYSTGSDSREINRTATGVSILTNNAQMRAKQIARNFAETGIKDLFTCLMKMNLEFLDKSVAVRLDKRWEIIDRTKIDGQYDIIIDVGIGTGQKDIKVQQMLQMLNISAPLVQMGVVTPLNIQEMLRTVYDLWGYKNNDKYVNTELTEMPTMPMGGIGNAPPPQGISTGQQPGNGPMAQGGGGAPSFQPIT